MNYIGTPNPSEVIGWQTWYLGLILVTWKKNLLLLFKRYILSQGLILLFIFHFHTKNKIVKTVGNIKKRRKF